MVSPFGLPLCNPKLEHGSAKSFLVEVPDRWSLTGANHHRMGPARYQDQFRWQSEHYLFMVASTSVKLLLMTITLWISMMKVSTPKPLTASREESRGN